MPNPAKRLGLSLVKLLLWAYYYVGYREEKATKSCVGEWELGRQHIRVHNRYSEIPFL